MLQFLFNSTHKSPFACQLSSFTNMRRLSSPTKQPQNREGNAVMSWKYLVLESEFTRNPSHKVVMALAESLLQLAVPQTDVSFRSRRNHTASWLRDCTLKVGHQTQGKNEYVRTRESYERDTSPDSLSGRKIGRERLWREFFSDPSQWWDHRSEKVNPRYPDFTHKKTQQSLWLIDNLTPAWVESKLAAIAPGTLQPSLSSWNLKLRRYVKAGDHEKTMELFQRMQREGMNPDKFTFVPVLNACANLRCLEEGRRVHEQIVRRGCESDIYVATCLVDMYAKCQSIENAWSAFSKMRERNVVSWNSMIGGYVKSEQGLKAMELFQKMQQEGMEPDAVTFVGVLKACASVAALEEGRRVHEQVIERGCESDVYVANCLVDMYGKCGSMEDAQSVFNKMRERPVGSWCAIIGGYVKSEQGLKAIELFREMLQEGVEPSAAIFVRVLNACAGVAALEEGRRVHDQIVQTGCESDVYVATCLVDMYAKSGSIDDARSVFNGMRERDVVSYNAMIGGYVKSEQALKAMELFREMQQEVVEPDAVTFVGVLNACASVAVLEEGKRIHEQIIRRGCEFDVYVATSLVDMYAKCGSIEDAQDVFDKMGERTVVSWSAMIGGYAKSGEGLKAMGLYRKMQEEGMEPNVVTFVGVVNACACIAALGEGRSLHEQIISRGFESNIYVATCLIDMYAKCGSIEDAWSVFTKMREWNVVSWNTMIGEYVRAGKGLKAMELFRKMQQEGVEPDTITFLGMLNACASVAALEEGRSVHEQIITRGCESHIYVANCLVDMYAKCGSIEDARSVFKKMRERNVVSWNAMIGGYAMHGHSEKAIELFRWMGKEGIEIDEITLTCLLSACSHGGFVKKGLLYFNSMTSLFNILPTREHYACIVDLLGRFGRLEEAEDITKRMPMEGDVYVWMSLLGACRLHGNMEMAARAAKRCWELDPGNASGHVLLSNIYAAAEKWERSTPIEEERWKEKCGKIRVELGSR